MIKVHRLIVGAMQSNCYLLQKNGNCIVIDPGDDADFITSEIQKHNLNPLLIASTHGHFDHNLAAFEVQNNFKIPFYISKEDAFLIKKMKDTASYWLKREDVIPPRMKQFEGKIIKKRDFRLEIIKIPGHTPGGVAFHEKSEGLLFSGDLIFERGGLGRVDFEYSDIFDFKKSLFRVQKLPKKTKVFPGHGESFTLSEFSI
jgi:glyoxylase-like metal-dependent hydrolase (beta-lactamase superfamily II)